MNKKNILVDKIESHYLSNLDLLPESKMVHFLSRLYLWSGRTKYADRLSVFTDHYGIGDIQEFIKTSLEGGEAKKGQPCKLRTEKAFRCVYKDLLGDIDTYNKVFFRIMFIYILLDIDLRDELKKALSYEKVVEIRNKLLSDKKAIFTLSTPASNFLYLVQWVFNNKETHVDVEMLLNVGIEQSLVSKQPDTHSRIYLYTHCIINESLFYNHMISKDKDIYQKMFIILEQLIEERYKSVSLDQKCEFLVCSNLLGSTTKLKERIFEECSESFSKDGDFIVDTHNDYKEFNINTLSKSEHRNVLFVMAFTVCKVK